MKGIEDMTPVEIEREGFRALCDRLGVAGALRFVQRAGLGSGDYTRERAQILAGVTLDELVAAARRAERRSGRGATPPRPGRKTRRAK